MMFRSLGIDIQDLRFRVHLQGKCFMQWLTAGIRKISVALVWYNGRELWIYIQAIICTNLNLTIGIRKIKDIQNCTLYA
jgi:hypothetical protein